MARRPSKMPSTMEDATRCLNLIGSRSTGQELSASLQAYVIEQLGSYPGPEMAVAWKRHLKERRVELALEHEDAAEARRPAIANVPSEAELIRQKLVARLGPVLDHFLELDRRDADQILRLAARHMERAGLSESDALVITLFDEFRALRRQQFDTDTRAFDLQDRLAKLEARVCELDGKLP